WVANRYMYQIIIPRKDAAILMNCPERDVRRAWISRIYDHDGDDTNRGGIESWFVLGEALGVDRETMASERLVLPAVRYACEAYLNFCRHKPWIEAVALAHRALRPGGDQGSARGAGEALPVDRPGRARLLPRPPAARAARRAVRARPRRRPLPH